MPLLRSLRVFGGQAAINMALLTELAVVRWPCGLPPKGGYQTVFSEQALGSPPAATTRQMRPFHSQMKSLRNSYREKQTAGEV